MTLPPPAADLDSSAQVPPPIFILSALPRSGTNYLWEVLRRHPDCAPARSPIWEDYLLKNAGHLRRFAEDAQRSWDPVWGCTQHLRPALLERLGEALVDFLSVDPLRRAVTKSPTIANLELFFELFPRAHLVLLVRDGRDVAVSGMKTFGWTLEEAARSWAWGADVIATFAERHRDRHVTVVRFEDIVLDPEGTLIEILGFLGLSADAYDLSRLDDIPVRGSSTYHGPGRSEVNWELLPRPADFLPVGRWKSWSVSDVRAFERIAGPQLARFGYRDLPVQLSAAGALRGAQERPIVSQPTVLTGPRARSGTAVLEGTGLGAGPQYEKTGGRCAEDDTEWQAEEG